ncbi:MAG: hypothetical protein QF410_01380 [Planctomycetota bacterium]|jgi:hypothetical protein|nr:hypothetical protein [Planctomycetota bacterium]MDP6763568.1 hypothetical protein [Planctomycetota bacterium]
MSPSPAQPERRRGLALRRGVGALCGGVVFWMPVWASLVLLAQVGLLGLRPARIESRRLAERGVELEERLAGHLERRATLEAWGEALDDPLYRERMRRLLDGR